MGLTRGRKRRFGVSLDSDLADVLDTLANSLGIDRSSIVEKAVKQLINDYRHFLESHECNGIIIIVDGEKLRRRVFELLERYRNIVIASNHLHINDRCIEIIAVKGSSSRIEALYSELDKVGCTTRFIPLH